DEVKQSADQIRTESETAEDAVITGKRQDHQQIHSQALELNPNRHTGSANLENPDNDDESIQVIDAGKVIAERNKRHSSESKNSAALDTKPEAEKADQKNIVDPDPRPSYIQGLKTVTETSKSPEEAQEKKQKFDKFYNLRKEAESLADNSMPAPDSMTMTSPRPERAPSRDLRDLQNDLPIRDEEHIADTHAAIKTVTVKRGDTLWSIAKEHLGKQASDKDINNCVNKIAEDNQIVDRNKIYQDQQLVVLDHSSAEDSPKFADQPVPGATYTVQTGDTLFAIAERVLGDSATDQQKMDYVSNTAEVNKLSDRNKIFSGQELKLPGIRPADDKTPSPEFDPSPEPTPESTSSHIPQPERPSEQTPEVKPGLPEVLSEAREVGPTNINDLNDEFLDIAKKHGIATEHLQDDLNEIKRRVDKGETTAAEIEKTYKHVERLLETESSAGVKEGDRKILAQQVIDHTARTKNIDQGHHNTCQVTSLECRIYQRTPSHAARMVTDLALTGKYTSEDRGATVEMPVKAVDDESTDFPVKDGLRSYASELFQVCAVNIHYVKEGLGTKYVQKQVDKNADDSDDTGERLYKKGEKKPFRKDPNLDDNALIEINQAITGEPSDGFVFCHETYVCGKEKGLTTVSTEADFINKLRSTAPSDYPLILGVHTASDPFWSDSNHGAAGGAGGKGGGGHFVSVRSYDSGPPPTVELDNQWSKSNDHDKMPVHQLFLAMHHPNEACKELEKDLLLSRSEGKVNPALEFDLMRLQLLQEPIKPSDVSKIETNAISLFQQQCQRWQTEKQAGNLDISEQDATLLKFQEIINLSPVEGKIQLRRELDKGGFISHKEYVRLLVEYGKFTKREPDVTEQQSQVFTRLLSELPRKEQFKMLDEILGINISEE
ncbi:MAG: LysM peptidoglycan-binding domain-containing protein, partial [Candidatus Obscuribacterales bacterium]|nr:LysM peptidoglycan-binding domain-containing protein [Candidatus Obscuribacterales bacterium]